MYIQHLEKHSMEQVVYTFWGKKIHKCFAAIKSESMSTTIIANIHIHKALKSTDRSKYTYHQQTLHDSQSYFPQCNPVLLGLAGLRVHQDKN